MSARRLRSPFADGWKILGMVLGLGLLLRVGTMTLFTPTVFNYYGGDAARYMRLDFVGLSGIFSDVAMPAGYPAFLAGLREASAWLPLTTAIQHLLGLAAAALLYAAVVRAGAPRWAALIPAAVVALSGDGIFLEHAILTEALWMPVVIMGMYLIARSIDSTEARRWLVAGGVMLACAALIRNTTQAVPVLVAIWAALSFPVSLRSRLQNAMAVLLPAALVIAAYLLIAGPIAGGHGGISENRGVILYGRVGQFADCTEFTPPMGTRALCSNVPPDERPGPMFWKWGEGSPLLEKFHLDSFDSDDQAALSRFARAAIVNQPFDYLRAAGKDFARFFAPGIGNARPFGGASPDRMSFGSTMPYAQGASSTELASQFTEKYSGVGDGTSSATGRALLGTYQSVLRVHGILLLVFIVLGAIGWAMGRGSMRAGASLFVVVGAALLLLPALTWTYDARFAVLPASLFAAGAAFGVAVLAERFAPQRAS